MINCIHLKCFTYEEQRLGQATVKYSIFKHKNQLSKKNRNNNNNNIC